MNHTTSCGSGLGKSRDTLPQSIRQYALVAGVIMFSIFWNPFDLSLLQQIIAGVVIFLICGVLALAWKLPDWAKARRRKRLRPQAMVFREEAKTLRDRIRADGPLWADEAEVERLCRDFQRRVLVFLRAGLPDSVSRFDADLTARPERFQPGAPFHISNWGNWIDRKLEALDEIIEKL